MRERAKHKRELSTSRERATHERVSTRERAKHERQSKGCMRETELRMRES